VVVNYAIPAPAVGALPGSLDEQIDVGIETNGAWGPAVALRMPADARGASFQLELSMSVACTGVGSCVVVGDYDAASSQAYEVTPRVFAVSQTRGAWGQARPIAPPSGGQAGDLDSVSCPSPGDCVAVGWYADRDGARQAMVASETGGRWGEPTTLGLPSGANALPGQQDAALSAVACTSAGDCTVVGRFTETGTRSAYHAMVATESHGSWGRAIALPFPGGNDDLSSLACSRPAGCVAVGERDDDGGPGTAMSVVEANGRWGPERALALPAGAPPTPGSDSYGSSLRSVSCSANGGCVGVGSFTDAHGGTQPMVAFERAGAWGPARAVSLPPGASPMDAFLSAVSCPPSGDCVGVGRYGDFEVRTAGMTLQTAPPGAA